MRAILPRLRNLLAMLAAESEPLPVREVADRLRVSRRTVFRELAGIGSVLGDYELEVGSRPGEGIVLEGSPQARETLLNDLGKLDRSGPEDRRDRQNRLVLGILEMPGQKLAVHADRFRVSIPTISHDLDDIEAWLAGRGLELRRRPVSGIFIAGDEMAVRRAVLHLLRGMGEAAPYPDPNILLDIRDMAADLDPLLGWMTPQSREALNSYLSVAAQRVMDGCVLAPASENADGDGAEEFSVAAARLAVVLSEAFNIRLDPAEVAALRVELSSCRPNVPRARLGGEDAELALLAGEMASLFDPESAPLLKLDEALMEGLVNHLRTAIVRLRRGIEIDDPMREQLERDYPEVMARSRAACEALRRFRGRIPESEVSLFAAHFAAARLRLSERDARRRTARAGIICVHGIGSSYLLASRMKRALGAGVSVEVGWHGDREKWRQYDILISTIELPDADIPVVVVPPMPGDDDILRVREALEKVKSAPEAGGKTRDAFIGAAERLESLASGARRIMERFVLGGIAAAGSAAGRLFGDSPEEEEAIARDLARREAVATQVVPELRIILLHCLTEGVRAPRLGILRPEGGEFSAPALARARACVVMLLPSPAAREHSEMMGGISTALVEQEHFLAAVQAGGADAVRSALERILADCLYQFTLRKLKG